MKTSNLFTIIILSTLAAGCIGHPLPSDTGDPGDGDGDEPSETETDTGEPLPDLPDGDGDGDDWPGECCECATAASGQLSCTPSSHDSCTTPGWTWCELDAQGNPSECAILCERQEPLGTCCDCESVECWQARESECSGEWARWCDPEDPDQPSECWEQCVDTVACCSCETQDEGATWSETCIEIADGQACEGEVFDVDDCTYVGALMECGLSCEPPPEGFCCDCDVWVGGQLACEPSNGLDCDSEGFEWCELDEWGTTAACETACGF